MMLVAERVVDRHQRLDEAMGIGPIPQDGRPYLLVVRHWMVIVAGQGAYMVVKPPSGRDWQVGERVRLYSIGQDGGLG